MDVKERMDGLLARVTEDVEAIRECFGKDAEAEIPTEDRHALLEASFELQTLVMSPSNFLELQVLHYQYLSCLSWLTDFDILAHLPLPVGSSVPFESVAQSAQVPLDRLKRVARMSITSGFLSEPQPGKLAHSRLSAQIFSQIELRDWVTFMTKFSAPTAGRFAEATRRWGDTVQKNQTAYNIAFETDLPFFEHVRKDEATVDLFAKYMHSQGQSDSSAIRHLLNGFDWEKVGTGHVVDVGGSTGEVAVSLANKFPKLQITVQDRLETLSRAEIQLTNLGSRIKLQPHDFFNSQPQSTSASADVFLLRKILHDWPFREAQQILNHISSAMKDGAQLAIMDVMLPGAGERLGKLAEAGLRVRDLTMAQSFNGGERHAEDWIDLIDAVSPRLRLISIERPKGSAMSVLVLKRVDGKKD